MLSINTDERLITMRMCAMGIIAGRHTIPSPEYLAETCAKYADAILQEHRKTNNTAELAATDSQQANTAIAVLKNAIESLTSGNIREQLLIRLEAVQQQQ